MDHHHRFGVLVIGLVGVLLAMIFLMVSQFSSLSGHSIVLDGGNISLLEISVTKSPLSWVGVYGRIANGSNQEISGGQVVSLNVSYNGSINSSLMVAALVQTGNSSNNSVSALSSFDWSSLSSANRSDINTFINVSNSSSISAEKTFTTLRNVSINSVEYEVWSAQTQSGNDSLFTYAFTSADGLIFFTDVSPGALGFENLPVDYQMILPLYESLGVDISFLVFDRFNPPFVSTVDCSLPINLTASALANGLVNVSWDTIVGATGYEVIVSDESAIDGVKFTSSSSFATANTSWLDTSNSSESYYRLSVIDNGGSCLSNETAGSMLLPLSPEYNLISMPFVASDDSVKNVLTSIDEKYDTIFEFDNDLKTYNLYAIRSGLTIEGFSSIKPEFGYWIRLNTTENSSLRLAGSLQSNMSLNLTTEYNLVGFPSLVNVSNSSVKDMLISMDDEYDTIFEFDNELKTYNLYAIRSGLTIEGFSKIKPGYGYWIRINESSSKVTIGG